MRTKTKSWTTLAAACAAALLALPAVANAYTVTVHVHGAGTVVETTPRLLMDCTTASNVSETSITDCTAGSASGVYNWGDIVNLQASVPQTLYSRGWRFSKWVDSGSGGQINCDPQATTGDHTSVNCQFQVFENLQTNLYFDDVAGPNSTVITSPPASPSKQTSATFGFNASDDPDALFDCRLDRPSQVGAYVACGGPLDKSEAYSGLTTNGAYTFYVRGRDLSGNVDTTPAAYSWVIDTVAPTVSISGTPGDGAVTNSTSTSFSVSATEGASPTCTIDGAAWACNTPKTGLADGSHTFQASATDAAGNTGTGSRTWTVNTVAPAVTISGTPADGATTTSPSTSFTVQASAGTPTCTIDGSAWPCNTPKTDLAPGSHTFVAQSTDNGNTGSDSRTWTVVAPTTAITSGPDPGAITGATVSFAFDASPSAECSIDDGPWTACASPQSYTLPGGSHSFGVRAKDGNNVDPTPAMRTWIVDADGDGSIVPLDCRDTDSSTHPGATDTPGDGIDQDCSGADAVAQQTAGPSTPGDGQSAGVTPVLPALPSLPAPAAMPATVSHKLVVKRSGTLFRRLAVAKLPAGTRVRVSCKSRSCPRKSLAVTVTRSLLVLKPFMNRVLKPATRVTITIARAGFRTKTVTYLIRAGKRPKVTVT